MLKIKRIWHNLKCGRSHNLWLDDVWPAPKGWYWVMTVPEAMDYLSANIVENASFDHDLGLAETGYDLIKWLTRMREENCLDFWPDNRPEVHSTNGVGWRNMTEIIDRYGRY